MRVRDTASVHLLAEINPAADIDSEIFELFPDQLPVRGQDFDGCPKFMLKSRFGA
jgi:hypothetical protein